MDSKESRGLRRKFFISFSVTMLVGIFSAIFGQYFARQQHRGEAIVDRAGRQRMLTQKISKDLLFIALDPSERGVQASRITASLQALLQNHKALEAETLALTSVETKDFLFNQYKKVEGLLSAYRKSVNCYLAGCQEEQSDIESIVNESDFIVSELDKIVSGTVNILDQRYIRATNLQTFLMLLFLALVLYKIVFVIVPAKKYMLKRIKSLQAKEDFLKKVESVASVGGWELDIATGQTWWTDQVYEIYKIPLGTPVDKIEGISYYAPHERERITQMVTACISDKARYDDEFEFIDGEGNHIWVRAMGEPILNEDGDVVKLIGTFQDVTEKKNAELEWQNMAKEVDKFFSLALDFSCIVGADGRFKKVNPQFEKVLRYSKDEVLGRPFIDFVHPDDVEKTIEETQALERGKETINFTNRYLCKDGSLRTLSWVASPDPDTGMLYATARDITHEIQTEAELDFQRKLTQHNSKLAAIGELAAGVGHEINNPLAIIKGYAEKLQKHLTGDREATAAITNVNIATSRIANIVKGLRAFSRLDEETRGLFDPVEALRESVALVDEIYRADGVQLDLDIAEGLENLWLEGHRGKFQQVVMNLISNARDATEGQRDRHLWVELKREGHFFRLMVKDNGSGMEAEVKERIFDPFFTTKSVDKGTGMGLSLAFQIIQEHQGEVFCQSEPGEGTEFFVHFPVFEETAEVPQINSVQTTDEDSPGQFDIRVMVVDDEEGLRDLVQDQLEELGAQVESYESAVMAFEAFTKRPEDFDLIISDIKMPEMDGTEFLKKIRSFEGTRRCKFLFITGGVNIDFENSSNEISGLLDGCIYKPFGQQDLLVAVANVMQKSAPSGLDEDRRENGDRNEDDRSENDRSKGDPSDGDPSQEVA